MKETMDWTHARQCRRSSALFPGGLLALLLALLVGCAAVQPQVMPSARAAQPVLAAYQKLQPPRAAKRPFMVTLLVRAGARRRSKPPVLTLSHNLGGAPNQNVSAVAIVGLADA